MYIVWKRRWHKNLSLVKPPIRFLITSRPSFIIPIHPPLFYRSDQHYHSSEECPDGGVSSTADWRCCCHTSQSQFFYRNDLIVIEQVRQAYCLKYSQFQHANSLIFKNQKHTNNTPNEQFPAICFLYRIEEPCKTLTRCLCSNLCVNSLRLCPLSGTLCQHWGKLYTLHSLEPLVSACVFFVNIVLNWLV